MEDPIAQSPQQRPSAPDSDDELVARAVSSGDAAAFDILVRRYQSQVRGFLRRLTRDHAQADDLAQETFVRAWDKLSSFAGHGRFVSWLTKLAYNEFLQAARKAKRYRAAVQRFEDDREVASQGASAPDTAAVTDLDTVLAELSEDERTVMLMSFALGLSHAEIGDATKMPVGTVKSHIHRARVRIRDTFGQE